MLLVRIGRPDLPRRLGARGEKTMAESMIQPRTYWGIFAALIGLTLLTVAVSFFHLGAWHSVVGLGIGVAKALLVALFFMHLLYSTRLIWLVAAGALFWFGILLGLTMSDYLTRGWLSYG
jgi:cytochrome c oxidase subunit 4